MTVGTDILTVRIPLTVRRRGGARKVVVPGGLLPMPAQADVTLVKAVARAFRWRRMLETGRYATVKELAAAEIRGCLMGKHVPSRNDRTSAIFRTDMSTRCACLVLRVRAKDASRAALTQKGLTIEVMDRARQVGPGKEGAHGLRSTWGKVGDIAPQPRLPEHR